MNNNFCRDNWDCDCSKNELDLDKLCAKKIKAHRIFSKNLCTENLQEIILFVLKN